MLQAGERLSRLTGDPGAGDALVEQFVRVFDLIAGMPRLGRPRSEYGRSLRSHHFETFHVFYRTHLHHISIERVIHDRRDFRLAFARRKSRKLKLTPEFEDAVWTRVDSGAYDSTDEVLGACVRALERVEAADL